MKKLFEGASIVSIIFLVFTTAAFYLFNVGKHRENTKERKKHNKEIEKQEDHDFQTYQRSEAQRKKEIEHRLHQAELQKKFTEEKYNKTADELERYKKLDDPLWFYYDDKTNKVEVYPGRYGIDNPRGKSK